MSIFLICLEDIGYYVLNCAKFNIIGIYEAYEFEENFYKDYLNSINDVIMVINTNEGKDRKIFKNLIEKIQDRYPGYLDKDEVEDLLGDINVYKLQKFLKKYNIMIMEDDSTDEIKFQLKNENKD